MTYPKESDESNEITPAIATWMGWQAAKRGRVDQSRNLVPAEHMKCYERGCDLPEEVSMICPAPEAVRRKLLRLIGGEQEPKRQVPPLKVKIVKLVKRPDVGTSTRYNVTIAVGQRKAHLRDLLAGDLLTWSRLRPIALDAGIVLNDLEKGQARMWLEAVETAMEQAEVVPLAPEESETGELIDAICEVMESAREWTWADDDPYPRGIAMVRHDGMIGWTRGPVQDAIRARFGKVSRVALSRALEHLGLTRTDIRIETSYIRLWARRQS